MRWTERALPEARSEDENVNGKSGERFELPARQEDGAGPPRKEVFRKAALDRLSSPEQLDQLMRTTGTQGWLALSAIFLLLLATLVWASYGTSTTEVAGQGLLLRQGGVSQLVAPGIGEVEEVLAAVGDVLAEGQPVATLRQDAFLREVALAQARARELGERGRALERDTQEARRLLAERIAAERESLLAALPPLERNLEILEGQLAAEREVNTLRHRVATTRLALEQLASRHLREEHELARRLADHRARLQDAEGELARLRSSLEEGGTIVARDPGRVLEVLVHRGQLVRAGTPVLSLESADGEVGAVLFVPAALAQQVRPGMEARLSRSGGRRESGFLVGQVTGVGEFPASAQGMRRLLANPELVAELLESGGPLIKVDVALERDPAAADGYRWSSGGRSSFPVGSGTLVTGSVLVRRERPIDLLLPAARVAREP